MAEPYGCPTTPPPHWRDRAACVGEDPEIFFPLSEGLAAGADARAALAVCRRCPVLLDCRTWAVEHGEDDGIWGATTAAQRRALRRATGDLLRVPARPRGEVGDVEEG
ncbi:WhiB family transcriptional regulator [Streptomyces lasalocidi]|uniref:Transcriptional regulator WhiB n=1 Tax=Streptomyces lasalocidi TaxID=324833 RepID=A0A4U5WCL8_STRLS|nr:WhiB family transcriptional regulator [Streptomyces lasalocidi]TKS98941.1 WhiB family transcriptional regulator [Streptomyces lasalocidi]